MRILIITLLAFLLGCNSSQPKQPGEAIIDKAVQDLKKQLILNYKSQDKKKLAIASFTRVDLMTKDRKYNVAVPELGEHLANSLQNDIFNPEMFDLLERQRIDGMLGELLLNRQGLSEDNLEKINLIGADLVILGTLQKRENSIRIDSRIVETKTGKIVSVANTNLELTDYILASYNNLKNAEEISERFEIVSNDGWQATKVLIKEYSQIEIFAEGQWSMTSDSIKRMSPVGLLENPSGWGDYRLYKNFNHGALLCRIKMNSELSQVFTIGMPGYVYPGIVECRINDNDLENNVGSVFVTIHHRIIPSE